MSFLTTLLNVWSGRNQAKQQQYQNQLEQQQLQQGEEQVGIERTRAQQEAEQFATQQRLATTKQAADLRAMGLDENGKPLPPIAWPKDLQQVLPDNKGILQATDADQASFLLRRAMYAYQQGQPALGGGYLEGAKEYDQNLRARAYALGPYAQLATARTNTEGFRQKYLAAQTKVALDLPARAREIAHGHDQAAWNRQTAALYNHSLIAQYTGQTRMYVAQLAGAYRFQTDTDDNAARMAVAELNNQTRAYVKKIDPRTFLFEPGLSQGVADPTADPYAGYAPPGYPPTGVPGGGMPGFPTMPTMTTNNYYGGASQYGGGGGGIQPPGFVKPLPFQGPQLATWQNLASAWVQAGGPPEAAPQMATIGMVENAAGDPGLVNPNGGATGLWQMLGHQALLKQLGGTTWADPMTNARGAVALYKADKAHGGTGFRDWEDSRKKGAFGGWGQFFGGDAGAAAATPFQNPAVPNVPRGGQLSQQAVEDNVRRGLASGTPPHDIRAALEKAVQAGMLTRAVATAAERLLPTPTPLATGAQYHGHGATGQF